MEAPGVHGVSIGYKVKRGRLTDTPCITFHVTAKKAKSALPASQQIPQEIDGVVTDVIEHAMPEPHQDRSKYRPVQRGCQIQPSGDNWVGTLGCEVVNAGPIAPRMFVTNQHVLPTVGKDIGQPSDAKGNIIGSVVRNVLSRNVDGAVGEFGDVAVSSSIISIGGLNGSYTVRPTDITGSGYPVRKRGRTTRLTSGNVTGLNYSGTRTDGWRFANQLFINSDLGESGDSGSVVVDNQRRVVGLYWGGGSSHGAASPIAAVMSELRITIPGGTAAAAAAAADTADSEPLAPVSAGALRAWARAHLTTSRNGKYLAAVLAKHEPELRKLIEKNPRVAAAWRKYNGCALCESVVDSLRGSRQPILEEFRGVSTKQAVDRLVSAFSRYGSAKLKAGLKEIVPLLHLGAGKTWASFISELEHHPSVAAPPRKRAKKKSTRKRARRRKKAST